MKSFFGGVHPEYNKITEGREIETAELPKRVVIPLSQHTGAPCEALVKIGDNVKVGQKIGDAKSFISAPVHASISGKVVEIAKKPHPVAGESLAVVIESSGKVEYDDSIRKRENVNDLSRKEIIDIIREAGIVGLGGAAFPTHVKLSPPPEKKIDTLILNGAECEPYLTCDHRLMIEETEKIIIGLKLIMKALDVKKAYIGIENNKENAIAFMKDKAGNIEVIPLKTKYPQGAEKMLIYSITKRKVPSGGLPLDVGVVVQNVGTAKAVYDAVYNGKPLIERCITVTGAVKEPKNLLVKIGTLFSDLISQCSGYKGEAKKIISGGPMMGIAQYTDEIPIIKGTSGILVLDKEEDYEEKDCIRCSKCVDVCPVNLMPTTIALYAKRDKIEEAKQYYALDCFECGCCAFICPSKIPLVQYIKYAKAQIMKKK